MSKNDTKSIFKAIIFYAGLVFTIIAPLVMELCIKNTNAAWISLLCGAFVSLMAKYDEIAEFTFGPIKARMRETIGEADATIEQLRKMASAQSETILTTMMASCFMGNINFSTKVTLHDEIIKSLRQLKLDEDEINRVDHMWNKGMRINFQNNIKQVLNESYKNSDPSKKEQAAKAREKIESMLDFPNWNAPSPEIIRQIINEKELMNPEILQTIEDYEFFIKTNKLTDPGLFDRN